MDYEKANFNEEDHIDSADEKKIRELLHDLLTNYKKQKITVPSKGDMALNGGEYCCLIFFNFIFALCILPLCCGFYTVEPLQAVVLMFMGKIIKVNTSPGLSYTFPFGVAKQRVSLGINTMELSGSSVPDKNGSPLNVSAVVTYRIHDPIASLFNIDHFGKYVKDQGLEVVKRVVAKFPYISSDPNTPSLLDDTMIIGNSLILQGNV